MSEPSVPPSELIRFGVFEVNLRSGELRKAGTRINLQEQPLQTLALLLEHPGELVTREELRQRLWPKDTFVDFEHGLNVVIKRLRDTLGDSADSPRFVETVPRRGYRFIAPVDKGLKDREIQDLPSRKAGHIPADDGASGSPASSRAWRRWRSLMWPAVVAIVAIGAALSLSLFGLWPSTRPPIRTTPLTSLPGKERSPSFSPDGSQIAFVWDGEKGDNEDIYVKVLGAEVPLRLTTNPAPDRYPVWSPDARQIAFLRSSEDGSGLFVIPALGGTERKVYSRSPVFQCRGGPSWSPDGEFLAIADQEGDQTICSIFILSLKTLKKRKLTSPPAGFHVGDSVPAFSPDGRTIAFNRLGSAGGIYVVPTAGGDPKRVTLEQDVHLERLAWLPRGRELIFSAFEGASNSSLWRVSASGGTAERLAVGGDNAANPVVSPRGNRLAYEQGRQDANIWKIAVPQSTQPTPPPEQLIASTRHDAGPHFSPDSTRIAFYSDRTGSLEIWVCDTAGSNVVKLTSFGGPLVGTPRWSPDGRRLAFEVGGDGNSGDIYVIDVEGGLPRRVTIEPSLDTVASWSADGQWIYFASNRTGRFEVWKVPAEGGRAVQVTKRGGFAAFESADGTFVYYGKGLQAAGLWKVPVNGGEETAVLDFPNGRLWGYWALANTGIYFVNSQASTRPALQFFSFGTTRTSHVVALDQKPVPGDAGLAISPDGRWLLYTQEDSRGSDIMLVENFR